MSSEIRWSLGAQIKGDGGYDFSRTRWLTETEVADLQEKFQFLGGLAEQEEFNRLLQSGQNWQNLFELAIKEGAEDGDFSESTQRGARREFLAFTRLVSDFGTVAEERTEAAGDSPFSAAAEQAIASFRETEAFEQLGQLAQIAEKGRDLLEVDADGNLFLGEPADIEALNLPVAVIGYAGMVIPEVLKASRPRFESIATEIKSLAAEVEEGAPSLIGVEVDPKTEEPTNLKLRSLPLRDIAVLEAAYEQDNAQDAVSVLLQNRERSTVTFGATPVDTAIRAARASEGMDALPEASFDLKQELIGAEPIDFWAPVTFKISEGDFEREMFVGVVQAAEAVGKVTKLKCEGAAALTEHTTGGMLAANIAPGDLIRSMIAQSGWEGELVLSEEPAEDTQEEFEVLIPIRGLSVDSAVSLGAVDLLPVEDGARVFHALEIPREGETFPPLRDEYLNATGYFRAIVTSTTPHEAEDEGVGRIEIALAWITTRGRYGTAILPDGSGQGFNRQQALGAPGRGPVVLIKGKSSRRQWLRWPHDSRLPVERKIESQSREFEPSLPESVPIAVRQALLALQLAAGQRDPYGQAISIWQAVESFAAQTKCRKLFSQDELSNLRALIPAGLDAEQREVFDRAIGNLNAPPVRERMLQRIKRDGIPLSDHELALLDRLRKARNDAVHGRELKEPPTREEVNYGIGIVARMLVHRVADLGSEKD